jgi:hypothetical protein
MGELMLLIAVILVVWALAALAGIVLCVAASRGDDELTAVRPTVLHSVDGAAFRQTRAG